mmetsp:Transcript_28700/g.72721  ORF Transcript_28700/g.72721 Transcript_28700/m.72721 type:complete len:203 (-) Transcript_28700:994-1602(-)
MEGSPLQATWREVLVAPSRTRSFGVLGVPVVSTAAVLQPPLPDEFWACTRKRYEACGTRSSTVKEREGPLYASCHSASLRPSPKGACCRIKVLGRSCRATHCHVISSDVRVFSAQASSVGGGGTRFSVKCIEATASRRGAMLSVSWGPVKDRLGAAVEAATAPLICFSSLCVPTSRYTAASSSAAICSALSSMLPHTVSFCL